uniref:Uncharacterized protein n=1 Tax=Arundo donax TaxID=35708 RepID=A0A0A9ESY1_ARUDO
MNSFCHPICANNVHIIIFSLMTTGIVTRTDVFQALEANKA